MSDPHYFKNCQSLSKNKEKENEKDSNTSLSSINFLWNQMIKQYYIIYQPKIKIKK